MKNLRKTEPVLSDPAATGLKLRFAENNTDFPEKFCSVSTPGGPRLLIRADASQQIGNGHVMRSLALAQAWQKGGGQVCLAARLLPEALKLRCREERIETRQPAESGDDAGETVELAREAGADWVVLDGYQFATEFQRAIKNAGIRLLVIDDDGCARHHVADLILNQNPCASRALIPEPRFQHSLAARNALCALAPRVPTSATSEPGARNTCAQGAGDAWRRDPDNCTLSIIEAIASIKELTTAVVVGPSNPRA